MSVSLFELFNVLVALGLISAIYFSRGNTPTSLILFLYGTFHFGFSSFALLSHDYSQLLIQMHNEGAGVLALSSGVAVLFAALVAQTIRGFKTIIECRRLHDWPVLAVSALALVAVFIGYLLNYRENDFKQMMNIASISLIFVFIILHSTYCSDDAGNFDRLALPAIVILILVTSVAAYELATFKAWSVFLNSDGETVYRASSLLFNPNLLGYWSSLVYIAAVYAWAVASNKNYLWLIAMVLAAATLYMSGSRSALALLIGVLVLAATMAPSKKTITAPILLLLIIFGIYSISTNFLHGELASAISLLGERQVMAFSNLSGYLFSKLSSLIDVPVMVGFPIYVPTEVGIAIEGRFVGEYRDAGWLVLHQDAGWLGVLALFCLVTFALLRLSKAYWSKKSVASVYAIAALVYCLMSGLVMRFQVFPVWIFIVSVMLIALNASRTNDAFLRK